MPFHKYTLLENVQQAKSILKKFNIPADNEDYQIIRGMLEKKVGWVGLFTQYHFGEQKVLLEELAQLFDKLIDLEPFLGRLPKTVVKYEKYEELLDDLNRLEVTRKSNRLFQELTSAHKQSVREADEEDRARFDKIAVAFYELTLPQQQKLLLKIKSFNAGELIDGFEEFLDAIASDFDFDAVKKAVDELSGHASIVYENEADGIMVVRLLTYTASMALNGRTLWCIRNSSFSWNEYMSGSRNFNTQYTVYNFKLGTTDPMSMIGVTIMPGHKLRTAHARYDEAIQETALETYLKNHRVDYDLLAPLSGEELAGRKAAVERMSSLRSMLQEPALGVAPLLRAIDARDLAEMGAEIAACAVRRNSVEMLEKLDELGYPLAVDLSDNEYGTSPFDAACSAKAEAVVEYLLKKGCPVNTAERVKYVLFIAETGTEEELHAYLSAHKPDPQLVCSLTMRFVKANRLNTLKWFATHFPLPMDLLVYAMNDLHYGSTAAAPDTVRFLFEQGFEKAHNGAKKPLLTLAIKQYLGSADKESESAKFFYSYLKENITQFDSDFTPISFAGDFAHPEWHPLIETLIAGGFPEDRNATATAYYMRKHEFQKANEVLTKAERGGRVNQLGVLDRILPNADVAQLKFLHERGVVFDHGAKATKKFQGRDMLGAAVHFSLGYEVIKYLVSQDYYTVDSHTIDKLVVIAGKHNDDALVRKLSNNDNITDAVFVSTVNSLVKSTKGVELVEFVAKTTDDYQYALTPAAMVCLLKIYNQNLFELVFQHEVKSLPIPKFEIRTILSNDCAYRMKVMARLNFDARDLLAACLPHNFIQSAKALFEHENPKVQAKIAKRHVELMALVEGETGAVAEYVAQKLGDTATNERRIIRRF